MNITTDQYKAICQSLHATSASVEYGDRPSVLDSVINATYRMCTKCIDLAVTKYVAAIFKDQLTEYHPDVSTAVDQTINLIHKDITFPFDADSADFKNCTIVCRDGTPAKFIAYSTTVKGKSVVAEVDGELYSYYIDGTYSSDGPHNLDLFIRQPGEVDTANE